MLQLSHNKMHIILLLYQEVVIYLLNLNTYVLNIRSMPIVKKKINKIKNNNVNCSSLLSSLIYCPKDILTSHMQYKSLLILS